MVGFPSHRDAFDGGLLHSVLEVEPGKTMIDDMAAQVDKVQILFVDAQRIGALVKLVALAQSSVEMVDDVTTKRCHIHVFLEAAIGF